MVGRKAEIGRFAKLSKKSQPRRSRVHGIYRDSQLNNVLKLLPAIVMREDTAMVSKNVAQAVNHALSLPAE